MVVQMAVGMEECWIFELAQLKKMDTLQVLD
jgi:hypothetical protein